MTHFKIYLSYYFICAKTFMCGLSSSVLAALVNCHRPGGLWEKAMAPHSSTLAWKILWTEEPGGLQSMGLLRVGHD